MSRFTLLRLGIAAMAALVCVQAVAQQTASTETAAQIDLQSRHFVENNGRIYDTDGKLRDDILYTATAGDARVYFGKDRISYVLTKTDARTPSLQESIASGKPVTHASRMQPEISSVELYRVDLEFTGGNSDATVEAGDRAAGVTRFYNVSNSGEMVEASEFGTITYRNVYDNIDIVFRMDGGGLKYDFVVRPGGRVGDIRLRYNGAEKVEVTGDGVLNVSTPLGTISEHIPAAFTLGADDRRNKVDVVFHRGDDNTVGFYHGRYDTRQSLIIDPAVEFSSYLGSHSTEHITNIGRQNSDYNFYAIGYTESFNFPVSVGAYQTTKNTNADAFIFKFDEDGNRLWATFYGGGATDIATAVFYDTNDDIVVVGKTASTNLPGVTGTSFQPANAGNEDAFIAKFSNGGSLLWATYYGGADNDAATGVYINGTFQIFISGYTNSVKTGAGAFPVNQAIPPGLLGQDGFLLKFSGAGARQVARRFGGSGTDVVTDMISRNTDLVVAGYTDSPGANFSPTTAGALQTGNAGFTDIFISKFNNLALAPVRTTFFGDTDFDIDPFISEGVGLEILLSFTTYSTSLPVTSTAMQPSYGGGITDAFIAVLGYTLDNTSLLHATYFGGTGGEEGRGITKSSLSGMTFVTGFTNSIDLPATSPELFPGHTAPCGGDYDGFLLQLSPEYKLVACSYVGGCDDDFGQQVLTGKCEKCVYLVGTTESNDFMTTPLAFQKGYGGGVNDGFFMKINVEPTLLIQAAGPLTIQTGGSVGLFVVPSPFYSMGHLLQWYRNGKPIPGATMTHYLATQPGRYYLVGTSANPACSTFYSNVMEVKYDCLDVKIDYATYSSGYVFPVGTTTIVTTATYNGYGFGTVTIPSGAVVNILNTTILAQSCAEIIIQPGGILRVTGSTIQGCSDWRGITVYGNPALDRTLSGIHGELYLDNCTLLDADVAVYSTDGGILDIRNSVFFDNRHCIAMDPYIFQHLPVIRWNYFDDADMTPYACFTPPFAATARPMVYADGVNGVPIDVNEFYGDFYNPATDQITGVEARNSQFFHVFDNTFEGALHTATYFANTGSITVRANDVGRNTAMHPENGIVFEQSSGDIIDVNRLYRCDNGVQYYTVSSSPTTVFERNLFEKCNFGLVISTNIHPVDAPSGINSTTSTLDMNIYCNKFVDNQVAIIGSGGLVQQGNPADEANNMFTHNRNWDLLWQGSVGTDFYQGSVLSPSLVINVGIKPAYVMNGVGKLSNDLTVQMNASAASSCRGSWIITSAQEHTTGDESIRLYPNPFADELTVELEGRAGAAYTVEVVDMSGRRIYSAELNNTGSTRLVPEVPASGVYIVRIYRNDEEIRSIPAVNIGR